MLGDVESRQRTRVSANQVAAHYCDLVWSICRIDYDAITTIGDWANELEH